MKPSVPDTLFTLLNQVASEYDIKVNSTDFYEVFKGLGEGRGDFMPAVGSGEGMRWSGRDKVGLSGHYYDGVDC